ncbi:hypothetical protein CEXT_567351 [Caerostris extrusa]|uniref:Uncharacterized protein n=1 Tax=Caerostris extrusa TaxID=172846 RepID=A0AAV4V7U3_CAEEX|nr:hypothetical protein CEXT_567351 [Caerostris extrusa]
MRMSSGMDILLSEQTKTITSSGCTRQPPPPCHGAWKFRRKEYRREEEEDEFGVVVVRASMHITQERRCRPIDGVIYFDNEEGLEAHLHTEVSSETSFVNAEKALRI